MAVIQLAFFALISLGQLNPTFEALSNLQLTSGYNIFPNPTPSENIDLPNKMRERLLQHFIFNINFTLIYLCVTLGLGAIFYIRKIISQKQKKEQVKRNSERLSIKLLCEYTFSGIMFCSYLISIAFIVELTYGVKDSKSQFAPLSIAIAAILTVMSVVYAVLFVLYPQKFGEFSTKFQQNKFYSRMYPLLMLERWITSTCLIVAIDSKLAAMGGIVTSAVLLIACLALKFHKKKSHTIRFCVNMAFTIIILVIYIAYNFVDEQTKSSGIFLYLPIVIIVILIVCIIYSAVFLIKSLIKSFCKKKKEDEDIYAKQIDNEIKEI